MMRVVIPVVDEEGSMISEHFGRAPYFAVFTIEEGRILRRELTPNISEHFGGYGRPPDRILSLKPDVVITVGMGPRALSRFQEAGVAVLRAEGLNVEENLRRLMEGSLRELTEGCLEARWR
ncbi:MAG TPA: dinitrogenase iron-molybdenum cofactor biosynthesis protein [Candidatus Bathyarchaeota archaeon]|nr:dinitrogenase iron-molybdenum cofactor biosynthesis protein [Candidatus Bathyarchaeota archaeon]